VLTSGPVIAFAVLAAVWELGARTFDVSYLPSVGAVLGRTAEMLADGEVRSDIAASLRNLAWGFGIAAAIGLAVGLLMGQVRFARYALEPYVSAMLMAPQLVFAPVLFIVFGLSNAAIITLIVLYTTFIIIVNTMAGLHAVDRALVDMARAYGASRFQMVRRIQIPSAMPMIMAGLRLGIGRAVKGMINGEMFIAFVGLGARAVNLGGRFDAEGVVAIVLIVASVALVSSALVQAVDRRVTRWAHPGGR
jgi:NitT/TauT family transport system permease protein